MSMALVGAARRSSLLTEVLAFAAQALIAVSFELGDDLGRGLFAQHGTPIGVKDAQQVVAFEAAHGFWIEPAWQMFFAQSHRILLWTITWAFTAQVMNTIYVFGHVFVTLGVGLWVYFFRRPAFRLLRNTLMLTNLFALVVYERFPVAPPRLTTGLVFDHHPFRFQDTVFGIVSSSGKLLGTRAGYNEFSAMPSVHMAWAILVGVALVFLAGPVGVKIAGALYPAAMLVAVVVTGNHYLLDVAGAMVVLGVAGTTALGYERWWLLRTRNRQQAKGATTSFG